MLHRLVLASRSLEVVDVVVMAAAAAATAAVVVVVVVSVAW